jgi:hypothetical protein
MLRRLAPIVGLTLLLGVMFAPAAHADTRFSIQIGPGYGSYRPGPGYVWQPGYYAWTGYGRRWVPGGWVSSYGRRDWGRERWGRDYRDSYWRRDRNWDRDRDRGRDRGRDRDRDRRDSDRDGRDRRR